MLYGRLRGVGGGLFVDVEAVFPMNFIFSINRGDAPAAVLPVSSAAAPMRMGKEMLVASTVLPNHADIIRQADKAGIKTRPGSRPRMYDSATTTGLNLDFPVTITSANAEILVSLVATRSRARRVARDNPYAKNAVRTDRNNVVGHDPFRLEMKVGQRDARGAWIEEKDTNSAIEEAWLEAGRPENCTVNRNTSALELDLQAESSVFRDGGILGRHWPGFPKNKFRYAIEPIEYDRLDNNYNRPATGTNNKIQFGIEVDQWDGPVAYHIFARHPGDIFAYGATFAYRERVPAEEIVPFFNLRDRAGQFVGMTEMDSIIQRLHRIDQYDIAEVTAAIWASCKPVWIKTMPNAAGEYVGDQESAEGEIFENVEPGTAKVLPPGYEPEALNPTHPTEAYQNFTKQSLRAVAMGVGHAYHALTGDLEGVNFSSGRLGENAQREEFKVRQKHMISSWERPRFEMWLKYALLAGAIVDAQGKSLPFARYEEFKKAARFHAKRWPYVNPLQDAQAAILQIEAGLTSRSRVISESDRGGDVEEVDAEQASDIATDELHKLDFSSKDPTTPTTPTGEPGLEQPNPEDGTPSPPPKTGGKQTIKRNGEDDWEESMAEFLQFRNRNRNGVH